MEDQKIKMLSLAVITNINSIHWYLIGSAIFISSQEANKKHSNATTK